MFLTRDFTVKVGDLNVSKIARANGMNYTQAGTPFYAAPEVWEKRAYDYKADVWSLGCIVYEMACLRLPFRHQEMHSLHEAICEGRY